MPSYVVTGANRGIGYGFVEFLANDKSNTVIGLVRDAAAATAKAKAAGLEGVHFVQGHITDPTSLEKAAAEIAKITGGSLDVLINNAGYGSMKSAFTTMLDQSPAELEEDLVESFRVNVVGNAHTINAFLPLIRKGTVKKVIVLSSAMADPDFVTNFGIAIAGPYAISKAATNLLVAKYHAAVGKSEHILFLAICPGVVQTAERDFTPEELEGVKDMFRSFQNYAPDFKGPMSPRESVTKQLAVFEQATVKTHGGQFISHLGNKQWI